MCYVTFTCIMQIVRNVDGFVSRVSDCFVFSFLFFTCMYNLLSLSFRNVSFCIFKRYLPHDLFCCMSTLAHVIAHLNQRLRWATVIYVPQSCIFRNYLHMHVLILAFGSKLIKIWIIKLMKKIKMYAVKKCCSGVLIC